MGTWAVWDVETLRWAREVPGGWSNPAGFGLAVAKVLDECGQMLTFHQEDAPALLALLSTKDLVVGFNSIPFDCGVLAAYGDVSIVRAHSLDLLASLDVATGIPHCVSLNNASKATLGAAKLLSDGSEAVHLWRQATTESRKVVEDYCEQDVRLTHGLWEFGATRGHILLPLRSRQRSRRRRLSHRNDVPWLVPVHWPLPVRAEIDREVCT